MPMMKGHSKEVVHSNIKELVKAGHKPKQAIAIALSQARKHKMAEGGMADAPPYQDPNNPVVNSIKKAFKMSEGGMVEEGMEEDADDNEGSVNVAGDMGESGKPVYPRDDDDQGLSENVMDAQELYEGLTAEKSKANNNTRSFEANDSVAGKKMNKSGIKQSESGMALGNKPDLDWINDGTEDSMSVEGRSKGAGGGMEHSKVGDPSGPELSEEAKKALAMRKAARRFGVYSPR